MDNLQCQPCRKTSKDENIIWNEKCDKVFLSSELNEFEKLVLSLNGEAYNPYIYTRHDAVDGEKKCQHYNYRESEQRNSQLTEENANSAFMNNSNENASFNISFEPHFNVPQLGNLLRICLLVV
ncbi:hypothetical protein AVEN_121079-1 [Araneus ventricosus]|uniref:Uncharacterized protein n=1 Tax=Araneus ventricosus TaxID=182803 RepID=A0A4Y2LS13_ARAVE|nr:hypothetical protein AVEN_121079-1 [Araneus ventricosus]